MSWKRGIELFDIIDGIVDDMRNTSGISSVTAVAIGYEYAALNELKAGEYISITDTSGVNDNLLVISAITNSFIIEENIPTALEFKAYAPYFRHEKIQKASQIYSAKSGKGLAAESQKYPLVLLVHSYPQNQDSLDFDYSSTFTIHIVTNSDEDYDSTQRYNINITPILIPIQEQLIQGLGDSNYTKLNTANLIDKEWTDLLYVDNNPFPDKLDGIQLDINNLEIINTRGCDVTPAPTEFNLTLSSGTGGTATSNVGGESDSPITVPSGDQVAAYALADTNYEFLNFLDNTNVVTQNPYPFVMKNNKDLVAQFISLFVMNVTTSSPILDTTYKFNDTTVNNNDINIQGSYLRASPSSTSFILKNNIEIDFNINGAIIEFIGSLAVGATSSGLFKTINGNNFDLQLKTGGTAWLMFKSDSPGFYNLNFNTITWTADDSFHRCKLVSNGVSLTMHKTIETDINYTSAISQTITIASIPATVPLLQTINSIGGLSNFLNGGLKYLNYNGAIFNFEDSKYAVNLFSSNTSNYASIGISAVTYLDNYSNTKLASVGGYTKFYYYSGGIKIAFIPYCNGISNIVNVITALGLTDYIYEEHPNCDFDNGFTMSLKLDLLSYDFDNTYFDLSDEPKELLFNQVPTQLNKQIYFDRGIGNFKIWPEITTEDGILNTVGENVLILGDSTADAYWNIFLNNKFGSNMTTKSYGGAITSVVHSTFEAEVDLDATLLTDKKLIVISTGYNDYNANLTDAQNKTAIDNLLSYLTIGNPTAKIIVCGMYNFGNPIKASDLPNSGGLTYDGVRANQSFYADAYGLSYSDLSIIGIIQSDIPDGAHTYTITGGYKVSEKIYDTANLILV